MKELVAQAMEDGAMGLSTSLLQPPSSLATTENLIELATIAKQYGGIYSSHIRDEGEGVFRAVEEAIQVGKGAGVRVDIIHMKIAHKKLWGRVSEVIAMVQKARDAGLRHSRERLSVHGRAEQPVVDHSAVGARRRTREDGPASARSGSAAANAWRGIAGTARLVQPLSRDGRRWVGMQLVSLRNERNTPFQGKRMSELIEARGGDPVERSLRCARRRGRQRADRVLPPFRTGYAAGHEAAVDVDRVRWYRRQSRRSDRAIAPASTLLRNVSARARALRQGAEGADAA